LKIEEIAVENLLRCKFEGNVPSFTEEDYQSRIKSALNLAKTHNFSHLVIYGDREHFSNIDYFSGYDPRFEEALLILRHDDLPVLIVGNEGYSYADASPAEIQKELYQSFSLMGQPRDKIKSLKEIFLSAGITNTSKVGIIGWKYFSEAEIPEPQQQIDVPYYIAKTIVDLVGENSVKNASDLMLHPEYGLRIHFLNWKDLILHEIAGTKSSERVLKVIENLKPGLTEIEASKYLEIDGEPVTAHPNVNFGGKNVLLCLASPTHTKELEKGEVVNIALGYRRAMVARTGIFASNKEEIPSDKDGIVEKLFIPYYQALVRWYESLSIGATGGEIFQEVKGSLGDFSIYGVGLNPGHLIHTDEWTHSIFYEGSSYPISSGMAIQCDIIAFPGEPYVGVHVEDGIVIANEEIRNAIRTEFPECWDRIEERRKFMKDVLGIKLAAEVLPTSNIQAVLFPYMANTKVVLSKAND